MSRLTYSDLDDAMKDVRACAEAVDREDLTRFTKEACDYTVDGEPLGAEHVMAWGIAVGAAAAQAACHEAADQRAMDEADHG